MGFLVKYLSGWRMYAAIAAVWLSSLGGTAVFMYDRGHDRAEDKCEAAKAEKYQESFDHLVGEVDKIFERLNAQEDYNKKIIDELQTEREPVKETFKEIVREKPIIINDDCSVEYRAYELLERTSSAGASSSSNDQ